MVEFIIIGAMKSGTTSFSDLLNNIPDVQMFQKKEAQFFSRYFHRGHDYYDSLYIDDNSIKGDASTCYSRHPAYDNVPEKICNYNKDMKLIYILRDPIDRAYSHYCHNVLNDRYRYSSFKEAFELSDEIISSSQYMYQIEQYLKFFKKEQILLLDFDDLKNSPENVVKTTLEFLGISHDYEPGLETSSRVLNKKGTAAVTNDITSVVLKIRNLPLLNKVINILIPENKRVIVRSKLVGLLSNSFISKILTTKKQRQFKEITENEIIFLSEKFNDDISKLESFWGRDLSKWRH